MFKQISISLLLTIQLFCIAQNVPDSAYGAFNKKLKKAENNPLLVSTAHYEYGDYLDGNRNIEKAIIHLDTALQIATTIANDSIIALIANRLGGIYWVEGDCKTSTTYYEKALQSALSCNSKMISVIKMNLSGNYSTSGQNDIAIQYAIDALGMKEKNHEMEDLCYYYMMVAEIFQSIDNIEKWKYYVHKAYLLKDNKQCAILSDIVMIYNNLGRIAETEKEYDKALAYYDTIIQVSKPDNYDQGMGIALLNSALALQTLKKTEKALEYAEQSEQYFGDVAYYKMSALNIKAQILQELERYEEALGLVTENITNENMPLYPVIKQNCLNLLYELNFILKNYQKAYDWNDSLRNYESKLQEEEKIKTVEEIETKYETEKKEQQIELLSAENNLKNQRIKTFIALVIILILVISVIVALYMLRQRKARLREDELNQKLLRSQMNPHFIFNALGSIQNYMFKNETKKAAGYLGNFASLTRSILEKSSEELISLEDEITMLQNYIELECMRMNESFSYTVDIDEELETEFISVPPMMIQPFVENALKHGLKDKKENAKLTLSVSEVDEKIIFKIEDNGIGISTIRQVEKSKHRSMSMQIFDDRKKIVEKRMKKKINLSVEDLGLKNTGESGTLVTISFPQFDEV